MIKHFAIGTLVALVGVVPLSHAQRSIETAGRYSGVDIGLAEIRCEYGDRGSSRRRGVLVATASPDAEFEVVLTAEHGLPRSRDELLQRCFLPVDDEIDFPVAQVWREDRRGGGYSDDWAVLLIRGQLTGAVSRYPLAPVEHPDLNEMISNDSTVRLPLRYAPTERPCELTPDRLLREQAASGLLAHNCEAWLGHSGSPILIELDGRTYILGLHLGSRWIFETSEALPLGRYVDPLVADAVDAAIETGRSLEPLPEARQQSWLQRLLGR